MVFASGVAAARDYSRRAQRVATLDGSAVLVDGGYSIADVTFSLSIPDPAGSAHALILELLANYPSVVLSCHDGCYLVLLGRLDTKDGITTVDADVLEDLG